ncbi:hypothetical protein D3C85_1231210 [compost metagenome]
MQQVKQTQLRQPAEQGAADTCQQPEHCQLQAEQQQRLAPRQPQAAQQRAGIEASAGESAGRQSHGNAGQQHSGQAGHVQVAFGLAKGTADLCVAVA